MAFEMPQLKDQQEVAVALLLIALCSVLAWLTPAMRGREASLVARRAVTPVETSPPVDPVSLRGAKMQGDLRAKVALLEFGDFQCPYCGQFARDTLPSLASRYISPGKVLLAFR